MLKRLAAIAVALCLAPLGAQALADVQLIRAALTPNNAATNCGSRGADSIVAEGSASCPAGTVAVGGSVNCGIMAIASYPNQSQGWYGSCCVDKNANMNDRVVVKCVKSDAFGATDAIKRVAGSVTPQGADAKNCGYGGDGSIHAAGSATCPAGFVALGGGGECRLPNSTGGQLLTSTLVQPSAWGIDCCTSQGTTAAQVWAICVKASAFVK